MLLYRGRSHVRIVRRCQHNTGVLCECFDGSTFARLEPEAFYDTIQVGPNLAAIFLYRREDAFHLAVELDHCSEVVVAYLPATTVPCHHCVIAHISPPV